MFNATTLLADALGRHLAETYRRIYGGREPEHGRILDSAGKLVIERIANSDALYHSTNHTALATLVGEAILRGRLLKQPIEPTDWLHFMLALDASQQAQLTKAAIISGPSRQADVRRDCQIIPV